jgi:putative mRNA 3-end processing factor
MRLSYQNANPYSGHESYYLKFEDISSTSTNCLLVDSGENVDVEGDLDDDDEYLSAILLTHAHADHYQTVAENIIDGAKVLTTPATASVLETVLSEASKHADGVDWNSIGDSIESITGWHSVTSDVEVRPVPAGHVPGACGYLVRFDDNNHVLATGDFTFDRAAGYPALPDDELRDLGVDVLFLNASTSEPGQLTESVEEILEQAVSGGHVLVTAGGMNCVKYVYVLGHLIDEFDLNLSVSIAGQAAKIYDDLGYDVPNITSYSVFDSTDEILESDISVAGPQKPTEGSSKKLFDDIRDDPSATLVRVLGATDRSTVSAGCTVKDFERVNHPTEEEVDALVETLNPVQTVVQHGNTNKWGGDRFHFTMTWSDDSKDSRVLYSDGDWQPPVWLDDGTPEMILENNRSRREPDLSNVISGDGVEEMLEADFPEIDPSDEPDLTGEGVEIEEIPTRRVEEDEAGREAQAAEKTEEKTEGSEAVTDDEVSLLEIREALERIEKKVDTETHTAFVVDTVGGDLLLRVEGKKPEDLDLEHGDVVEVSVFEESTES